MKYVCLPPGSGPHPLPFYLAMEEYLARKYGDEPELWFEWIVPPTVIIGRNQLLEQEINVAFCKENGIDICRRKSGGGAVYSDSGNIMLSYICDGIDVQEIFSRYAQRTVAVLRSLGLNAEASGRNDVLVDGAKVSGNAFYQLNGRSIVHGTMLFDTDFYKMTGALTPSAEKLKSKAVESVRSRVTTLRPRLDGMNITDFTAAMRHAMTDGELHLTDNDVDGITCVMAEYMTPEWLIGRNPKCSSTRTIRIERAGEFNVTTETRGGFIVNVAMTGDFFTTGNLEDVLNRLRGVEASADSIATAISDINMTEIIPGIDNNDFIHLIVSDQ